MPHSEKKSRNSEPNSIELMAGHLKEAGIGGASEIKDDIARVIERMNEPYIPQAYPEIMNIKDYQAKFGKIPTPYNRWDSIKEFPVLKEMYP